MAATFDSPIFSDETAAREALESIRWPDGPVCPHCGCMEHIARVAGEKQSHRPGLLYCNDCMGQFTVTVGTVFERSKIPLTKWWVATFLLCSSKKGISSHQISRTLGVTYKTAWFMTHRIREAMKDGALGPIGGEGKTVEADETFLAKSPKTPKTTEKHAKPAPVVLSLVERGGAIRSMYLDEKSVRSALNLENFFSIFKRGLVGTYQHMDKKHLDRYLAEFDFRRNTRAKLGINDTQRTAIAMNGIEGKRLTYRRAATGSCSKRKSCNARFHARRAINGASN